VVSFTLLDEANVSDEQLRARFHRELLDQDLRGVIASETEALRNLVVAHALSRIPLIHPELESGIPQESESASSAEHKGSE
jgi:hypothetical protein